LILILNTFNTDTKYNQYSYFQVVFFSCWFVGFFCYYATFLRLLRECHIQNLLEQKPQIAPILINIGSNLTGFRSVRSVDLLGWGSHVLKRWGTHVLRVLSKIAKNGGGRMSSGCSQQMNFAPSPRTFYN
jgi:hypothetical protein